LALVTSYSSLVSSVQNYLARGDLATDAPGFVQNWESAFYRQPKNHGPWMEAQLSGVIASNVLAVPADFLNLKVAYIATAPACRLEYVSLEQLYGRFPRSSGSGTPQWMSRDRTNFVFGPEADSGYTVNGTYIARPTSLRTAANDAQATWIILYAPDLALYGSLLQAEPFLKNDNRIAVWQSFYAQALKDYRDLMEAEKHSMPGQEVLG
jgi:hypothetical protein